METSPSNRWIEGELSENNSASSKPLAKHHGSDEAETEIPANSFTELFKNFASETSFGGISKITFSDGNIKRFIWLLISVTCYSFTIMYCLSLVNTYLSKPIKTTVDITYRKNMDFPSVTVCNLNQFRKTKLQEVKLIQDILQSYSNTNRSKSDGSSFEASMERLKKMQKKDLANDNDGDDLSDVEIDEDVIVEQLVVMTASYYNKTQLKKVGHQFNDTILSCSWKGVNCLTGYFVKYWVKHWNWKYGNCFTFNPGGNEFGDKLEILHTSKTGPHQGISLDINIEQSEEYVDELTPDAGALITVHEPKQFPFPHSEGITVAPGFSSSIAIRKESITRVDPHNNNSCHLSEELPEGNIYRPFMGGSCKKYTVKACMESCLAKAQYERCGCSDAKYAWLVGRICHSLEELQCIHHVSLYFKTHKLDCDETCPQPCQQSGFLHSIMTATLSSKEKKKKKAKNFSGKNDTDFDFDDNFLRVKVYYDEFNLEKIVQSTYYDISSLIGDVGGQLGLWVGISIISVAEFGELLINLCIMAVRRYKDRRKTTTGVIELQ